MPEELSDQLEFQPRSALLSFEEIERVVRMFAGLGVRKIRLTGGEPTVRRGIVQLVRRIAAVPGIDQVVMTSNGHLLGELAAPLAEAGLRGINISIDTLDPARFAQLTSRGDLARVMAGIEAAVAAGLRVKLNAVALRGVNDDELAALCRYAWSVGAVPRLHRAHADVGRRALRGGGRAVRGAIRRALEAELGPLIASSAGERDAGPARYWRAGAGARGARWASSRR